MSRFMLERAVGALSVALLLCGCAPSDAPRNETPQDDAPPAVAPAAGLASHETSESPAEQPAAERPASTLDKYAYRDLLEQHAQRARQALPAGYSVVQTTSTSGREETQLGLDDRLYGLFVSLSGERQNDDALAIVAGLPGVVVFWADDARFTSAGLRGLAPFTNLYDLRLVRCPVTDAGLAPLAGWRNVLQLRIVQGELTDAGLAHLAEWTKLRELYLSGNPIAGPGLRHLARLEKLHTLDLSDTLVTDEHLASLAALPALDKLNLGGTPIANAALERLEPRGYVEFNASRTALGDPALARIAAWSGLRALDLSRTRVTSAGLANFFERYEAANDERNSRPSLRTLVLDGVPLGDDVLAVLRAMPFSVQVQLEVVSLKDCGLGAEAVAAFRRASLLKIVVE